MFLKKNWVLFDTIASRDADFVLLHVKIIANGVFDDENSKAEDEVDYFDAFISDKDSLALEARKLTLSNNSSAIIYTNSKGEVVAIQDIDNSDFHNKNTQSAIINNAKHYVAQRAFLVTQSEELYDSFVNSTSIRPFSDILFLKDNVYTSIHDSNNFPVEDAYAGKIMKRYSESIKKNK